MRHSPVFYSEQVAETARRLGQRLRAARKARGITLEQLMQACRVHRTTLSRLEKGDPGVSMGVLLSVLETLNELSDVELLVSQPELPRHQRRAKAPELQRDF